MVSVMAIGSEVIGECVEEIKDRSREKDIEDSFGVSCGLAMRQRMPGVSCHWAKPRAMVPGIEC